MKKVLIIQQVPHEGPGTLGRIMERAGIETELVKVCAGAKTPGRADRYSAVVVLGGPMGVYEEKRYPFLTAEIRLIESALRSGVPVMGICLGAQLLARAAGAAVFRRPEREIGWYDIDLTDEGRADRLLFGLPRRMKVFQWHGDTFDIPPGAVRLASSRLFENQLFRIGPSYGFQFHLEVTESMILQWLEVNGDELADLSGTIDPAAVRARTPLLTETLRRYAEAVFSRWLRGLGSRWAP
ncbi:MAG TPA: type 1 glutamine amidotransferase [Deltaproteobacteria bacterium]|nr:type 1 glutamine amidotransferase [Deltaproteobacteria bacterium]